ncbi:carboxylate-amine ligase [Sulfitobacter dubius]|uniref:carboxylate-amine ligase n=1 Tax=Sulfitobacter dubius TaxID=218673 RepID=UPI0029422207|nr:carboxylate-amine ligase [Sulfitobacter dubius]WOI29492.1 carboxylate-amine ligase [Sulfitobacter dubius]
MQSKFTIGIEEEYLLVDKDSLALADVPEALMDACREALQDQVSPEFLACQIEIGTKPCETAAEARDDLCHLRRMIAHLSAAHNLAPIAAACHPFSDWKTQETTDKQRYSQLESELEDVARRMLICGMHVHVGIDSDDLRLDLMPQLSYFLPHLLALSASSPFWKGEDTGLASYRMAVMDNMPRTGLPPQFDSWAEYERTTGTLVDLGIIADASKVWWDLRPSVHYPTLEARICDVQPRLDHAIALAALTQALCRMLLRLRDGNLSWRKYDRFLISENRWRAQRYGTRNTLIDFGDRQMKGFDTLFEEILGLVAEDAEALGCLDEICTLRDVAKGDTSADRQRKVWDSAPEGKGGEAVVRHLMEEYHADL